MIITLLTVERLRRRDDLGAWQSATYPGSATNCLDLGDTEAERLLSRRDNWEWILHKRAIFSLFCGTASHVS